MTKRERQRELKQRWDRALELCNLAAEFHSAFIQLQGELRKDLHEAYIAHGRATVKPRRKAK